MARPRLDQPNFRLVRRGDRLYVRWWQDGRWQRVSTGTGEEREARRFLNQWAAGHATPEPPTEPDIGAILDGYLADKKGHVAAYGTLEACCNALRRHLGDLQPAHLLKERSRFYARQRRAEGHMVGPADARRKKPTSDGTIIRELVTLRAALRWAIEEKWISEEPVVEPPSAPPARDRWLTRDEAARLLASAKAAHLRLFILLALHTAGRRSAILELTWDRVDLDNARLALGRGRGNKRRAIVPINADLMAALREAHQGSTCAAVVAFGDDGVESVKTAFGTAVREAGLKGVTPHTLRHTSATWMVQAGEPLEKVAAYLANTVAMVEKVYGHHSPEWLASASNALVGTGLTGPLAPETKVPKPKRKRA